MISSFSRSARSRKQASKFISSLSPQDFARQPDDYRTRHGAAVVVGRADARNIVSLFDWHQWNVDGLDHRLQLESVRLMKLGAIARPAAQCDAYEERDLISVVDLGDGVDAG